MRPTPKALLRQVRLPALLISDLTNIRYITGLSLSAGIILVTQKAFHLYVDARYTELAGSKQGKQLIVRDRSLLQKDLTRIKRCGFEGQHVTVATLQRWKKLMKKTTFISTDGGVEYFRRQKDSTEIRCIKKATAITQELMSMIPRLLKPGITERGVAWILEMRARELGAEKFSFEPIVAFGPHTSRPHHRAGDRKLKKGDLVQIDIGVFYKGYSSDMSRVFATGPLSKQQKETLDLVQKAYDTVMKQVKVGARVNELDAIVRDIFKECGLEKHFTHALGHGVGLEVHEGVTLAPRDDRKLLKGEVIAIEPGLYFEGKFGVRIEDLVIVK